MKWIIVGSVAVSLGIAVIWFYAVKRKSGGCARNDVPWTSSEDISDTNIINALPEELKARIVRELGSLPSDLTADWMLNDLMADVCMGDSNEVQKFLDALINASKGSLRRAAVVGDLFDMRFMEPDRELPARYTIKGVVYSGLVRTKSGEVLLKAAVI